MPDEEQGHDLETDDERTFGDDRLPQSADTAEETISAPPPASQDCKPLSLTDALKQSFGGFSRRLAAGGSGRGGRAATLARPRAQPATGTEEDRVRVTYIDRRERLLGFFLGGMLGVLAIVLFFEFRRYVDKGHPTLTARAHNAAPEVLVIGLVLGALIIGATLSKRRAMLGFSLLLGGLALLQLAGIFGLVYLGVGLWMVFRAMRRPRPATSATGGTGAGRRRAAPGQGTATAPRSTRTGSPSSAASLPAGPHVAPGASKRYTPPKPHKRPAPPAQKGTADEPSGNRLTAWLRR